MDNLKDGFLGYQTSLMLDVVVCALIIVVPWLLYSLYQVKFKARYARHKSLQIWLGLILLLAVGAFEIDLQLVHGGWENIVRKAHPEDADLARKVTEAQPYLWTHLVFAISTPFVWAATLALAIKRFGKQPVPGEHSQMHKTLGWISTVDITLTAVTGLLFYYVAFMTN